MESFKELIEGLLMKFLFLLVACILLSLPLTASGEGTTKLLPTLSLSDDDTIDKFLTDTSETLGGFFLHYFQPQHLLVFL